MNFILVNYKHNFYQNNLLKYYQMTEQRHKFMLKQIDRLYDHYHIHVITNLNNTDEANVNITYHRILDLECNNYSKLRVFGLLTEPAMYVDNDILLTRRFAQEELVCDTPFNIFTEYNKPNLLPKKLRSYTHYNTGIIWIPRPDKEISKELLYMKKEFDIHDNGWVNDEYPISYFIKDNNLKMSTIDAVNEYREEISFNQIFDFQSIHYTGCQSTKDSMMKEEKMLRLKIL